MSTEAKMGTSSSAHKRWRSVGSLELHFGRDEMGRVGTSALKMGSFCCRWCVFHMGRMGQTFPSSLHCAVTARTGASDGVAYTSKSLTSETKVAPTETPSGARGKPS
jgi:hypothetical protein